MNDLKPQQVAVSDKAAIAQALVKANLPIDGLDEFIHGFMVTKDERGGIVAVAAIERHNHLGLLRSVAVDDKFRGQGLGLQIVSQIIDQARSEGVKRLVLLTTTARDFFARHFGFYEIPRHAYDNDFSRSSEWHLPICSSAAAMQKDLTV